MEWTRTDTIALAKNNCAYCHGLGLRFGRKGRMSPCNCVLRTIFRACYARFRHCAKKEKFISRVSLDLVSGRDRNCTWGRKDEEYMADFILVARRTLAEDDYRLFKFHYLLGADWRLCCKRMKVDRGTFFHYVYRIEEILGRTFRELEPYALFPVDEYFNGPSRTLRRPLPPACAMRMPPPRSAPALRRTA